MVREMKRQGLSRVQIYAARREWSVEDVALKKCASTIKKAALQCGGVAVTAFSQLVGVRD